MGGRAHRHRARRYVPDTPRRARGQRTAEHSDGSERACATRGACGRHRDVNCIAGATTGMEHIADGGKSWTTFTDEVVARIAAGTYIVRYAATADAFASEAIEVSAAPDRPVTPPTRPSFDASIDRPQNGTVAVSPESAKEGATMTITATPDFGYKLEQTTVTDDNGATVELADNGDGSYSFAMPPGDITVSATFADVWTNLFSYVSTNDCFYGEVRTANPLSLMSGYADTTFFGPNDTLTREQAATVMWNMLAEGATGPPPPSMATSYRPIGTHPTPTGRWRTAF